MVTLLTDQYSNKSKSVRLSVINIVNYVILEQKPDRELASLIFIKLIALLKEIDFELLTDLIVQTDKLIDVLEDKDLALQILKYVIPVISPELCGTHLLLFHLNKVIQLANNKELANQIIPKMLGLFEVLGNGEERFLVETWFLNAIFQVTNDKESIVPVVNNHFKHFLELLSKKKDVEEEDSDQLADGMTVIIQIFEFIEDKNQITIFIKKIVYAILNYSDSSDDELDGDSVSKILVLIAKTSGGKKFIPQIIEILSKFKKGDDSVRSSIIKTLLGIANNEELIVQTLHNNIDSIGFCFVKKLRNLIAERNELLVKSINKMLLLFEDSNKELNVPDYSQLNVLSYLTWKAIGIFGATELTLKAIDRIDRIIKKCRMENQSYDLEKENFSATKIIAITTFSKRNFFEDLDLSTKYVSVLIDQWTESFNKLRDKFKLLSDVLKSKYDLSVEALNKQLFDNRLDEIVKQKIAVQVCVLNQDKSNQNLEALKRSLVAEINYIFEIKAPEIVEIALKLIGHEDSSNGDSKKKKLRDAAKEVLELQVQHLSEEGVEWLSMNLKSLMKLSEESKLFLKKVFTKY